MFRGRSSNYGGRGGTRNTAKRNQPKGVFADGIWHCDCIPRIPAEHFKVKKDGKNHGRWFYTCQQAEEKRCGFFLWDDDAKPREEAAVLSGRRTEPGIQEGWNAGRTREEASRRGAHTTQLSERTEQSMLQTRSPPPAYSMLPPTSAAMKRSAQDARLDDNDDDDSFDSWPLNAEDEERLANAADTAVPITPQKVQRTEAYPTPATTGRRRLPWIELPPNRVPQEEEQDEDYFSTPSKATASTSSATISQITAPETPNAPPTIGPASTPSPPTRHRDAMTNPADDASSLTSEVLASLSTVRVPPATLSSVRSILTKHDLRTQGIKKGRDISRLALKAKDAKIAELQARIASLEADRELERAVGRAERREAGQQGRVEN